jgi:peptidoglycan/LPS O-acetylase OafA/YrhL
MLANYRRRGHISLAIWLIAGIAAAIMAPGLRREVWEHLQPATVVAGISVAGWCYAFIAYAQAKGYPGIAGLLLALLNLPGLLILILLKDKHKVREIDIG